MVVSEVTISFVRKLPKKCNIFDNKMKFYIDDAGGFDDDHVTNFFEKVEPKGLSRKLLDMVNNFLHFELQQTNGQFDVVR